jgi:hypothetical protein
MEADAQHISNTFGLALCKRVKLKVLYADPADLNKSCGTILEIILHFQTS